MKYTQDEYKKLSDCIKVLVADSVEKAGSGHPGMPLGMSDVMTILAFNFLKFNPNDPLWFNRDRLVLSAGHGSMLLYAFYYLTGYSEFTLEDLKNFRQLHSKTPGHPEYGAYKAIETTTGPLGQGFANAVGMAIAAKKYQQKLGADISDYKIYCIVGDGCLMEGISYEAGSLAGHLCLDNLVILFDDNRISIDGRTNLAISEDQLAKFSALGFSVDRVDGHDFDAINQALQEAQNSKKPHFIACRTLIAKGCTNKVDSEIAHGSPLGGAEIKILKENLQIRDEAFFIPAELKKTWESASKRSKPTYDAWQQNFANLPSLQQKYLLPAKIEPNFLHNTKLTHKTASTRALSGYILEELLNFSDKIICGSADLSLSNNIKNNSIKVIHKGDFSGNFIHYGVREHAMAAIMNGIALSGFLPIGGTFFVFADYMKPAIRLSAIMGLHVIYIMTHDSIGVGEDGATHQPIEQLASMRATPNLNLFRPADYAETIESWHEILSDRTMPHILVLTRQNVRQIKNSTDFYHATARGGYNILPDIFTKESEVKIFASGSEVQIAIDTAEILAAKEIKAQVISVPCFNIFFKSNPEYINSILGSVKLKVGIEAACSFGWHRIIGEEGLFFGIDQFGLSAPASDLYQYFGLTAENIAQKIQEKLGSL